VYELLYLQAPMVNELFITQEYGSSPLCMCWCVFKLLCLLNDLLHTSQEYGWSSPCTIWCSFRRLWCEQEREKKKKINLGRYRRHSENG
jgi:hypothetical protein